MTVAIHSHLHGTGKYASSSVIIPMDSGRLYKNWVVDASWIKQSSADGTPIPTCCLFESAAIPQEFLSSVTFLLLVSGQCCAVPLLVIMHQLAQALTLAVTTLTMHYDPFQFGGGIPTCCYL